MADAGAVQVGDVAGHVGPDHGADDGTQHGRDATPVALADAGRITSYNVCYTKLLRLQKDTCEFRCLQHAEGPRLNTRDGTPFLTINGIQTQSARIHNLLNDLPLLRQAGAGVLRLLPQSEGTRELIGLFADALAGRLEADAAFARSREFMKDDPCNRNNFV